jgi:uncharacterized membrane protein YccC
VWNSVDVTAAARLYVALGEALAEVARAASGNAADDADWERYLTARTCAVAAWSELDDDRQRMWLRTVPDEYAQLLLMVVAQDEIDREDGFTG